MLTPRKIQELAEPIEAIYISLTNELLVNIGKHITSPTWTHTAAWEIQKLSELGQLTAENAEIINRWIKQIPEAMRETMEETRAAALDKLEEQLERAAEAGYVTPPLADSTVQVFQDLAQQASDRLNLVNTTLLESSLEQYQKAIELTADLMQRAANTQAALNEAAASVVSGVETRTTAMQRAIAKIAADGLTGFYDRTGRSWSPEAYVNMDIRTTVHNAAIEAVKSRMADYNTSVFQISSHAGARSGCYPYQGWFCSWDNTSGQIELGDGSVVSYRPIKDTTYGEPAGIFGINCGHYPIPIIPGLTIPHGADNIQPKEENDKAYALSQEQRALERKIREAKRAVEMGDTSDKAKQAVKDAQADMRQFIAETGRTRRYDREHLHGIGINAASSSQTTRLNTYHDPMREKMGSAFESHPDEMNKLLKSLMNKGVEVEYRAGSMSYSPSATGGRAGKIIMDPAASYSAWLHELRHLQDDEASGWQGMSLIKDKNKFAELEEKAYKVEIDFAKENGYTGIARRLERLSFERRQEIRGEQKNNRQPHE